MTHDPKALAHEATMQIAVEISKLLTAYGIIPQGGFAPTLQAIERIVQKAIDNETSRITKNAIEILTGRCKAKHKWMVFDEWIAAGGNDCPLCLTELANALARSVDTIASNDVTEEMFVAYNEYQQHRKGLDAIMQPRSE